MIFLTTNQNDLQYLYHVNGGNKNVIILWIKDGIIKHRYTPASKFRLTDGMELIDKFDYVMGACGEDGISLNVEANGDAVIWDYDQYIALTNRKVYVYPVGAYKIDTSVSSQSPSMYAKKLPNYRYEAIRGKGNSLTLKRICNEENNSK